MSVRRPTYGRRRLLSSACLVRSHPTGSCGRRATLFSGPEGEEAAMAAGVVTNADALWQDGYLAPSCKATGGVRSTLFHPEGYSLWQVDAELSERAELRWAADGHGEEAVYVLQGELDVDGVRCGPEGTAIIEAGAGACIRAITDARIAHFGPSSPAPPAD